MKAMIIRQFGGPAQLHLADVADPVPGQGQVRVAVHAAGVNPVDTFNRADGSWRAVTLAGGHVDAIADLVGGQVLSTALGALRPAGLLAAIAAPELDLNPVIDANITFHGVIVEDNGQRTRELASLLASGALRPVVSHVLPLSEAADAHRIQEGQHAGGKIVLTIAD